MVKETTMPKIKLNISDSIADTLFITLNAKAIETGLKDPLIKDPYAVAIKERVDYNFEKFKNGKTSRVGVAIRAKHLDEQLKYFLKKHPAGVVVLVGCGLDSRIERIAPLANDAFIYQLDIPEVIECHSQLIPPRPNEEYIPASMLTTGWMDTIISRHPNGPYIIIIEGVLMYFNEADNKWLFTEMAKRFKGAEIHFDVLNVWMSKQSARHDTVKKTKASFKFGIDDNSALEQWSPGLKLKHVYSFQQLKGWRRMGFFLSILMSTIPVFKNSSRLLVYRIN